MAILTSLCYLVVALANLEIGIALWVPLVFLQAVPALNAAGKLGGIVLVAAWLGYVASERGNASVRAALPLQQRCYAVMVALVIWVAMTSLWGVDAHRVVGDLWHWVLLAVLFVVVATTITTIRGLRRVCTGLVAGTVLSIAVGTATGSAGGVGADRLAGGAGDPNFLAACIVSAIVIAAALAVTSPSRAFRICMIASIGWLTYGLIATESRGGTLAAVVAMPVAVAMFPGRRRQVLAISAVAIVVGVVGFALSPDAWARLSETQNGGTGRVELWTMAWRSFEAHPIGGVGLTNFQIVAQDYVREPGLLEFVRLIADKPHVAHNTYLEMLSETGIIGLALFAGFVVTSLSAGVRAAYRFEAAGDQDAATLARAIATATIAMLVACIFLSSQIDKRLWILLSLGPAVLAASAIGARRRARRGI